MLLKINIRAPTLKNNLTTFSNYLETVTPFPYKQPHYLPDKALLAFIPVPTTRNFVCDASKNGLGPVFLSTFSAVLVV